jgi:nitroreductase
VTSSQYFGCYIITIVIRKEMQMDYDSLLELVKQRRSIRRFRPDPIHDELVDKIIEVARWAPSAFNLQPWEFVVVREQGLKDSIVQLIDGCLQNQVRMETTRERWQGIPWKPHPTEPMDYSTAPVFILLFGDTRTKVGLTMMSRFNHELGQSTFNGSLTSAFLYMHLAVAALGLASQWVSQVSDPTAHCLLKDLLGIPAELEVYGMMAVGYPGVKARPKLLRNKEKMVHHGRCAREDFRTNEEVNDFIRRNRAWVIATHRQQADKTT